MGGGQSGISKSQLGKTNAVANQAQDTANSLYGQVQPFLANEVTNPQGMSKADLNAATEASNQALGGTQAAATGAAGLKAARTRNDAGITAAIDESAREGGQTQSENAANLQTQNALLKNAQQQAGASGLSNLYGQNLGETEAMYGLGPSTIKAGQQPGWFQNLVGGLNSLSGTALNAAKIAG